MVSLTGRGGGWDCSSDDAPLASTYVSMVSAMGEGLLLRGGWLPAHRDGGGCSAAESFLPVTTYLVVAYLQDSLLCVLV